MTAVNNHFKFLGLPTVLQKKIMQDLPLKDLARQAEVCKLFKTFADSDHSWINVAKQLGLKSATKKEVIGKVGEIISEVIAEVHKKYARPEVDVSSLTLEGAKSVVQEISSEDSTFAAYACAGLLSCLGKFSNNGDLHSKILAKIYLKAGTCVERLRMALFIDACERDIDIFKAYLEGQGKTGKTEIDLAFAINSPSILRHIYTKDLKISAENIAYVIYHKLEPVQRGRTEEMWKLVLQICHNKKAVIESTLETFQKKGILTKGIFIEEVSAHLGKLI